MTSSDIRPLLRNKYALSNWKRILNALFPNREFLGRPIKKDLFTKDQLEIAKEISIFGEIQLTDSSLIGFYAVELKSGKSVSKSRVGLRNLIDKDVIPGNLDGILAVYFSADSPEWRMSFISKSATWDEEGKMIKEETQPRRYTYVFGPEESCETAIERFQVLFANVATGLKIDHLLQAFSVEKISTEFFDQYCHHYETLTEYLEQSTYRALFEVYFADEPDPDHQAKLTNRAISNFVKKFMGRLVFLYFLQKKGWLGNPRPSAGKTPEWGLGDRNFIKNLFTEFPEPTQFYRLCLTQLFFGTLNTRRPNDIFEIHPLGGRGLVPYLNGGLFEKDAFEPININFKTEDLKNLFDFFDSYNFTIDENLPADQDVGVDPEMLGLIFENLLEDNKDKGTFYTPKEVVHFMCRESLSVYLQQKLRPTLSLVELHSVDTFVKGERSNIPSVVTTHADVIYQALDEVRICDPAIGSGAFPMGMVLELFDLKRKLSGLLSKPKAFVPHDEKLRIIRENIYGVDLDKGAVDIARLRFWLSLIVDEQAPAPLPNLDYKIMQGDSLVESFEGIPLDNVLTTQKTSVIVEGKQLGLFGDNGGMQTRLEFSDDDKNSLRDLVSNYFDPALTDKKGVRQRIDSIIHDNIEYNFELIQKQNSRFIEEKQQEMALIPADSDKDSPGKRKQKTKAREKLQRGLDHWLREEEKLLAKKDKLFTLEHKDEKPYFLWHLFFNDILTGRADAGFDIVIGNPPYGVEVSEELTQHYKLGSKDSYGAFMSMALRKLLKPAGVLCYIVSDTWLTIKTHLLLRKMLLEHKLYKVIRLHQDCFKATVNPCIFTLSKTQHSVSGHTAIGEIIAADLTYISTRKDVPQFRELIFNLETFVDEVTPDYAVYSYSQALIHTNTHKPIIIANPKLFALMNDTTSPIDTIVPDNNHPDTKISCRQIKFNDTILPLIKFGDIADVKVGLQTGDNDYYLYQNPEARGSYKNIGNYAQYLLTDEDLEKIRNDKDLRLRVIEEGIHQSTDEPDFEEERYFGERYILKYDKGGESSVEEGWLPNYYVPTDYYIDYSTTAVNRLKTLTTKKRNELQGKSGGDERLCSRFQNKEFYFLEGITYSPTGIYSPTYRLGSCEVFGHKGSTVFLEDTTQSLKVLGILNSKVSKYFLKNYYSHTIETREQAIFDSIILANFREAYQIEMLVSQIITKQKQNPRYDYQSNEQREIDRLVYELYGLNEVDIQEVERWFARRYPKLRDYAYVQPDEAFQYVHHGALSIEEADLWAQIARGENKHVEFKSTLLYDIKLGKETYAVKHSVLKTLAAFANSEGGNLLIGVTDKRTVFGLDHDYALLNISTTVPAATRWDVFRLRLDSLIEEAFGNAFAALIDTTFIQLQGHEICIISVKPSQVPFKLYNTEKKTNQFYIRRLSSSKDLTEREIDKYVKIRWPNGFAV